MLTSNSVVQTIGGAFLVSAGESAFEARLTKKLQGSDSNIDPLKVIGTGATEIRNVFAAADIPFILRAYNDGIQTAMIVAIAFAVVCTIIAFGSPWKKLVAAEEPERAQAAPSSDKAVEADALV